MGLTFTFWTLALTASLIATVAGLYISASADWRDIS
jgi:hypothetical protein